MTLDEWNRLVSRLTDLTTADKLDWTVEEPVVEDGKTLDFNRFATKLGSVRVSLVEPNSRKDPSIVLLLNDDVTRQSPDNTNGIDQLLEAVFNLFMPDKDLFAALAELQK